MADASVSETRPPAPPQSPQAALGRDLPTRARRLFWPGGLSSRLLILTVIFVAVAGLLILPSLLAQYEIGWLSDRVHAGELASMAVEAAPNKIVNGKLSRELTVAAQVVRVAVVSGGVRRMALSNGEQIPPRVYLVDLREGVSFDSLMAPIETLFGGSDRLVLVRDRPRFRDGDLVEVLTSDGPLKHALSHYLLRLLTIAAIVALVAGVLVYLTLNALFVRPMQRITKAMERFRADPEDPAASLRPSGRRDEIGQAEAELDRMQADLRAALSSRARLAALGEAVAKINHDLRNMLTSAQIASERLAQSGDPTVARALPRLERALDRAITLASNVLAYGKSDEAAPSLETLWLAPAVEAAAEDAGLTPDGVRLDLKVGGQARVLADPDQLHRILVNLLRNGREALSAQSDRSDPAVIQVSLDQSGGDSLVRLADNGPGVPERVRSRLFQPFAGSGREGGVGLGLAIARELAQAHGGDLTLVKSTPEGAVFDLRLAGAPEPAPRR